MLLRGTDKYEGTTGGGQGAVCCVRNVNRLDLALVHYYVIMTSGDDSRH